MIKNSIDIKRHLYNLKIHKVYSYTQLFKEFFLFPIDYYLRDGRSCAPLNIVFFVTLRCNACCTMCNLQSLMNPKNYREPSIEDIEQFLKSVYKYRPSILLFGGEPFIRDDIVEIIALVKRYQLSCGIFTNGLSLNKINIEELMATKIDYITFSFFGLENVYQGNGHIENYVDIFKRNIGKILKARNKKRTKVAISVLIAKDIMQSLEKITEFTLRLKADLVTFRHPAFINESERRLAEEFVRREFPDEEDIKVVRTICDLDDEKKAFAEQITDLKQKYGNSIFFRPQLDKEEIEHWYSSRFTTKRKCLSIWRSAFIMPNGDVFPCEAYHFKMGNIFKEDFMAIWNKDKYRNFRDRLKRGLLPGCERCCGL